MPLIVPLMKPGTALSVIPAPAWTSFGSWILTLTLPFGVMPTVSVSARAAWPRVPGGVDPALDGGENRDVPGEVEPELPARELVGDLDDLLGRRAGADDDLALPVDLVQAAQDQEAVEHGRLLRADRRGRVLLDGGLLRDGGRRERGCKESEKKASHLAFASSV